MFAKKISFSVIKGRPSQDAAKIRTTTQSPRARENLKKRMERDVKKNKHLRSSQRQHTFIVSEMTFPDKDEISISGTITDFSEGGMTFRPFTDYLEHRENENVEIHFNGHKKHGIIRSSRPDGYGLQVIEKFSPEEVNTINRSWEETRQHLEDPEKYAG